MKKNILFLLVSCLCACIFIASCDNHEMPRNLGFSAYEYSNLDEDGGTWVPILLTGDEGITVDPPADVNSPEYQNEVNAVKSLQASLSKEQRDAVQYWTNNPLIRWN